MEKWRKIVITILLFPFLLGIGLFVGLLFWLSLGVSLVIPAIIIIWLLTQERKRRLTSVTPTPPTAPGTPTPVTPATPSGGWKSWIPTIVILAVLGIAGYWLYSHGYVDTAKGYLPKSAPTVAPKFGCSSPGVNDKGNLVYVLTFNEDSTVLTTMCSLPLNATQNFSLEVVRGEIMFWNGTSSSAIGAEGVAVDSAQNGYKLEASLPLGILMTTVDGEPWLGIGKEKTYFTVTSKSLEVKNGKGKLLRSFPITLPKEPGGWGSKLSLGVNCQGKNKADQSKICTAAFEVRQEYFKK